MPPSSLVEGACEDDVPDQAVDATRVRYTFADEGDWDATALADLRSELPKWWEKVISPYGSPYFDLAEYVIPQGPPGTLPPPSNYFPIEVDSATSIASANCTGGSLRILVHPRVAEDLETGDGFDCEGEPVQGGAPIHPESLNLILQHEIGHILGLSHDANLADIRYLNGWSPTLRSPTMATALPLGDPPIITGPQPSDHAAMHHRFNPTNPVNGGADFAFASSNPGFEMGSMNWKRIGAPSGGSFTQVSSIGSVTPFEGAKFSAYTTSNATEWIDYQGILSKRVGEAVPTALLVTSRSPNGATTEAAFLASQYLAEVEFLNEDCEEAFPEIGHPMTGSDPEEDIEVSSPLVLWNSGAIEAPIGEWGRSVVGGADTDIPSSWEGAHVNVRIAPLDAGETVYVDTTAAWFPPGQ